MREIEMQDLMKRIQSHMLSRNKDDSLYYFSLPCPIHDGTFCAQMCHETG